MCLLSSLLMYLYNNLYLHPLPFFYRLARRVVPDEDSQYKSFVRFDKVNFDCDDDSGISFNTKFVGEYLSEKERKKMLDASIEPLTLWSHISTIKSNATCVKTKAPLTREEYAALPPSFGLSDEQRQVCYDMFITYEAWIERGQYWDEACRALYVFQFGPSVYRDELFTPWVTRVNKWGEVDLLNDDGNPLFPFFFDCVSADEAQDFTEVDIALFLRMSNSKSLFLNTDPAQVCIVLLSLLIMMYNSLHRLILFCNTVC